MFENTPDKKLEDFRYDAKLFRQAYRAGLKAKEIEEENKQRKKYKIIFSITLLVIILFLTSKILRGPLFKKIDYLKMQSIESEFKESTTDFNVSPPPSILNDESLINAKGAIYADLNSGEIMYSKNIKEPMQIASLTKLMSALVAVREYELSEVVEVKKDWYDQEDMEWSLGLDKGDTIEVQDLLKAMLISSYNDAAYVLADHMEGGWEVFVVEMNDYAQDLGLISTQFNNPSGLNNNGGNISNIEELYKIATVIYKNKLIMDILSQSYAELEWEIGDEKIYSTNGLLGKYGNIAGKTGYTEEAGRCFLGITKDGKVTVVLGADNRFEDSEILLKL